LNPDFAWNFENEYKNGIESIFEIQFQELVGVYPTGRQLVQFFTSRTTEGGWGFHLPTQDLWDAYSPDDPRLTYTFILTGDKLKGDNYLQDNSMSPSGYHDRKIFVKRDELQTWNNNVSKNWVLIRYADVLLMYAEALNENGKSAEALLYLNAVRERARNSNPLDPKREIQVYVPQTDPSVSPAASRESMLPVLTFWNISGGNVSVPMAILIPARLYLAKDSNASPCLPMISGQWITVVFVSASSAKSSPWPNFALLYPETKWACGIPVLGPRKPRSYKYLIGVT
jgi:hypothetical protein